MTQGSPEYQKLKESLRTSKQILGRVPDTENTTTLHHLKVQSYILLAHAAFEEYLEELTRGILTESVARFYSSKKMNPCVASLIAFETVAQFDQDSRRQSISKKVVKNLDAFVGIAKNNHLNEIRENHGIKLKDQRKLLISVGIDPEEVDLVTAQAMDAFGTKRGGVAHTAKIQISETKSTATNEVSTIFSGLRALDDSARSALTDLAT